MRAKIRTHQKAKRALGEMASPYAEEEYAHEDMVQELLEVQKCLIRALRKLKKCILIGDIVV